jgi:membrane protein involved in colicin uptake
MNAMHEEALVMNKMFDDQRAAQIEADHEMALLMNDKFDRDREDSAAWRNRLSEHEERIKREAAEARRDAEAKHKAEIEAAARREAEEKARAELAERQRIEAEQRAAREKQMKPGQNGKSRGG